eukprot:378333-Amphidinium_carterae.1
MGSMKVCFMSQDRQAMSHTLCQSVLRDIKRFCNGASEQSRQLTHCMYFLVIPRGDAACHQVIVQLRGIRGQTLFKTVVWEGPHGRRRSDDEELSSKLNLDRHVAADARTMSHSHCKVRRVSWSIERGILF